MTIFGKKFKLKKNVTNGYLDVGPRICVKMELKEYFYRRSIMYPLHF